eukprot:TRINITY_DN11294_c0_g1_i1.p1 TRINITY_DN11294_c0_g1~~TRINITY_DN11294_c0_g1_i1.p1  ORF type:complete len:402 (-),score=76.36 TRINITY_DN11294_c0_g1_i1:9-1214(-)
MPPKSVVAVGANPKRASIASGKTGSDANTAPKSLGATAKRSNSEAVVAKRASITPKSSSSQPGKFQAAVVRVASATAKSVAGPKVSVARQRASIAEQAVTSPQISPSMGDGESEVASRSDSASNFDSGVPLAIDTAESASVAPSTVATPLQVDESKDSARNAVSSAQVAQLRAENEQLRAESEDLRKTQAALQARVAELEEAAAMVKASEQEDLMAWRRELKRAIDTAFEEEQQKHAEMYKQLQATIANLTERQQRIQEQQRAEEQQWTVSLKRYSTCMREEASTLRREFALVHSNSVAAVKRHSGIRNVNSGGSAHRHKHEKHGNPYRHAAVKYLQARMPDFAIASELSDADFELSKNGAFDCHSEIELISRMSSGGSPRSPESSMDRTDSGHASRVRWG